MYGEQITRICPLFKLNFPTFFCEATTQNVNHYPPKFLVPAKKAPPLPKWTGHMQGLWCGNNNVFMSWCSIQGVHIMCTTICTFVNIYICVCKYQTAQLPRTHMRRWKWKRYSLYIENAKGTMFLWNLFLPPPTTFSAIPRQNKMVLKFYPRNILAKHVWPPSPPHTTPLGRGTREWGVEGAPPVEVFSST